MSGVRELPYPAMRNCSRRAESESGIAGFVVLPVKSRGQVGTERVLCGGIPLESEFLHIARADLQRSQDAQIIQHVLRAI